MKQLALRLQSAYDQLHHRNLSACFDYLASSDVAYLSDWIPITAEGRQEISRMLPVPLLPPGVETLPNEAATTARPPMDPMDTRVEVAARPRPIPAKQLPTISQGTSTSDNRPIVPLLPPSVLKVGPQSD